MLYPAGVPFGDDAMTARAHRACNNSMSDDEEIARNYLSTRAVVSGDESIFQKVQRSFARPQGRAKAEAFRQSMGTIEGVPGVGGVFHADVTALTYVLVKIAKGSLFHNTSDNERRGGAILRPQDVRWTVRTIRSDTREVDLAIQPWQQRNHIPGVLDMVSMALPERHQGHWLMMFYGTEPMYSISATPRTRTLTNRDRRAVFLQWPRPRGVRLPEPGGNPSVEQNMITRAGERPGSQ